MRVLFRKHPGAQAIRDGIWERVEEPRGLGPERPASRKHEGPRAAKR